PRQQQQRFGRGSPGSDPEHLWRARLARERRRRQRRSARTGGLGAQFGKAGSHRLSGRRQEDEDAQASPDDRSRADPSRISRALESGVGLPDGRAGLRRKAPRSRQENRPRPPAGAEAWTQESVLTSGAVEKAPRESKLAG